jgi:hypothetical protein
VLLVAFKERDLSATILQPEDRAVMQSWAARLQQWRVHQVAATMLEAAGPLKIIGAQLVFIGQPLFSGLLSGKQLETLAGMLEEPDKTRQFIQFLREDEAA